MTVNGKDVAVGRWVEFGGEPCYEDSIWGIEQDAAELLNAADGGDRYWDDGRHTEEIRSAAEELKAAWESQYPDNCGNRHEI